jgi:hypothetical protein
VFRLSGEKFLTAQTETPIKMPQISGAIKNVEIGIGLFNFPSRSNFFALGQAENKG